MRAWQVRGAGEPRDVLHLVDVEPPAPGPGEVRVRVTATGVGLPDAFMCRGTYPLTPGLPFTPGQEVTGVVTALGDGVDLALDTPVMGVTAFVGGRGGFAEECLMAADGAFAVPEGLGTVEAAGFWIPHLTAWIGLVERGGVVDGDVLVVLGAAGSSGIAAVQLGRALGAQVIAVVSDDERAALCRACGADEIIDRTEGLIAPRVRSLTDGRGADLVYDPVGGALAEDAMRGLARGGRLLAVGFASGSWPQLPTHDLVIGNLSLVGVFAGRHTRGELDAIHAQLAALLAAGALRDTVTEQVPFDELPGALQRMADGRVVGKLVVVP
jgi:NADPH2:quinone reductase